MILCRDSILYKAFDTSNGNKSKIEITIEKIIAGNRRLELKPYDILETKTM